MCKETQSPPQQKQQQPRDSSECSDRAKPALDVDGGSQQKQGQALSNGLPGEHHDGGSKRRLDDAPKQQKRLRLMEQASTQQGSPGGRGGVQVVAGSGKRAAQPLGDPQRLLPQPLGSSLHFMLPAHLRARGGPNPAQVLRPVPPASGATAKPPERQLHSAPGSSGGPTGSSQQGPQWLPATSSGRVVARSANVFTAPMEQLAPQRAQNETAELNKPPAAVLREQPASDELRQNNAASTQPTQEAQSLLRQTDRHATPTLQQGNQLPPQKQQQLHEQEQQRLAAQESHRLATAPVLSQHDTQLQPQHAPPAVMYAVAGAGASAASPLVHVRPPFPASSLPNFQQFKANISAAASQQPQLPQQPQPILQQLTQREPHATAQTPANQAFSVSAPRTQQLLQQQQQQQQQQQALPAASSTLIPCEVSIGEVEGVLVRQRQTLTAAAAHFKAFADQMQLQLFGMRHEIDQTLARLRHEPMPLAAGLTDSPSLGAGAGFVLFQTQVSEQPTMSTQQFPGQTRSRPATPAAVVGGVRGQKDAHAGGHPLQHEQRVESSNQHVQQHPPQVPVTSTAPSDSTLGASGSKRKRHGSDDNDKTEKKTSQSKKKQREGTAEADAEALAAQRQADAVLVASMANAFCAPVAGDQLPQAEHGGPEHHKHHQQAAAGNSASHNSKQGAAARAATSSGSPFSPSAAALEAAAAALPILRQPLPLAAVKKKVSDAAATIGVCYCCRSTWRVKGPRWFVCGVKGRFGCRDKFFQNKSRSGRSSRTYGPYMFDAWQHLPESLPPAERFRQFLHQVQVELEQEREERERVKSKTSRASHAHPWPMLGRAMQWFAKEMGMQCPLSVTAPVLKEWLAQFRAGTVSALPLSIKMLEEGNSMGNGRLRVDWLSFTAAEQRQVAAVLRHAFPDAELPVLGFDEGDGRLDGGAAAAAAAVAGESGSSEEENKPEGGSEEDGDESGGEDEDEDDDEEEGQLEIAE